MIVITKFTVEIPVIKVRHMNTSLMETLEGTQASAEHLWNGSLLSQLTAQYEH